MILSNYWKYLYTFSDKVYTYGTSKNLTTGCKTTTGSTLTVLESTGSWIESYAKVYAPRLDLGVTIGSGTTEPTTEDYALESDCSSSFSNFQYAAVFSADGDGYKMTITVSGQNNTADTIVIKEVGVYKNVKDSSGQDVKVLFVRHILTTPKTVESGSNFSFVFEWIEA